MADDPWQIIREAYDRLSTDAGSVNYGRSPAMVYLDMLGVPQEWRKEPLSDEEKARRKAKNKRRAATRFRAREFRRAQDAIFDAAHSDEIRSILLPAGVWRAYNQGVPYELRRSADASVSAADRPAGPAATQRGGLPAPEAADIDEVSARILKAFQDTLWYKAHYPDEPASVDLLAAIREIARK